MLHAKVERETKILAAQNEARRSLAAQSGKAGTDVDDQVKYAQSVNTLKPRGAKWDSDAIKAQQQLVSTLQDQVTAEQKVSELKKLDQGNAKQVVNNEGAEKAAEAARAAAEHQQRMGEMSVAAEREREQAGVLQTLHQASIAERLASDIHLADEEYAVQLRGNRQLVDALDKGGKDFNNQLKALHEKAEELTAQHGNNVAPFRAKLKMDLDAVALESQKVEPSIGGLLDVALDCIARGWHVFPCILRTKRPIGALAPNGFLNATIEEATVRSWWTMFPEANVAISTGANGLVVLDCDHGFRGPD